MSNLKQKINENAFEEYIENYLVTNNVYVSRHYEEYNKEKCIDTEMFWKYIEETQKEKLDNLISRYGEDVKGKIVDTIDKHLSAMDGDVNANSLVDILRDGINYGPEHFELTSFAPKTGLNDEVRKSYEANVLSVMRQVKYSQNNNNSLDMVIFLNGLPIFTLELKNQLTGQNVENAMHQYKTDRDANEKLLRFKRCIAHFAVDTDEVFVSSKLEDEKTFFLPFNKGNENGKGNPNAEGKHKTHYLWEEFLRKDRLMDIIEGYVHTYEESKEKRDGKSYKEWVQLFPRYHQYTAVREMIEKAKDVGAGKNYLIQHSAGSGKSLTIAWLAYKLAELHDTSDEKVYDSVIVLTDRKVLDKQLRNTIRNLCKVEGVLKTIDESQSSRDLKNAIESGAKIITSTIHKFPMIVDTLSDVSNKKFAIIVDEAHSSQGGEMVKDIHIALGDDDGEDYILSQVNSRTQPKNISYFAFTATPKQETLERFGERQVDGSYKAFSLYSMKQAIEENFIIDVLDNYLTYKTYFRLVKESDNDPQVKRGKALSRILKHVNLNDKTIHEKVEVIVEHFEQTIKGLLDGDAKAMIVTSSRESAVRYKLMLDTCMAAYGLKHKSLVAFTGDIELDGKIYTESNMNGVPDTATAREFKKKEYKFLIVAEKYQTGFDEPYLCAMYVDKRLSTGPQAVQTLSRLNRTARGKKEVYVLDFVNEADSIKKSFDPYYESTILAEGTDINKINEIKNKIYQQYKFDSSDIEAFSNAIKDEVEEGVHAGVNSCLDAIASKVLEVMSLNGDEEEVKRYRSFISLCGGYIKHYPFLSQVIGYADIEAEKLYLLLKYLVKKLPRNKGEEIPEIFDYIDLDTVKVVKGIYAEIGLGDHGGGIGEELKIGGGHGSFTGGESILISQLVNDVNKRWGTNFGEEQQETLEKISEELSDDENLQEIIRKNTGEKAEMFFKEPFENIIDNQFDTDKKLWQQLNSNEDLKGFVMRKMFKVVKERVYNLFG